MESLGAQTFHTILARQPGTIHDTGTRARRRVLVVEDNIFVARQCKTALSKAGYEVIGVVTTAEEAVEHALQQRPTWS